MLGAIIGDTVGSIYEFCNINSTKFPLFSSYSKPTDDSVMTMAVAEWLLSDPERTQETLEECMVRWGHRYPHPMGGYGGAFSRWLFNPDFLGGYRDDQYDFNEVYSGRHPYNSWGNGSAMRVSSVAWLFDELESVRAVARLSAEVSHNHPEGIKGAQVVAGAIYLARSGASKETIRSYAEKYYKLDFTLDEIRPTYHHVETCQETVPEAMTAFMEGESFEDVIRTAVSLGGDCDTLTCIAGSIAEGFYGVPEALRAQCRARLPEDFVTILDCYEEAVFPRG